MGRNPTLIEHFEPDLPRAGRISGIGKVTVTGYKGNGYFWCIGKGDVKRLVHRRRITFIQQPKPKPASDD